MPVTGLRRYQKLFENIANPATYLSDKISGRKAKFLRFTTKPLTISFTVPRSLYLVFKEIFLQDVYDINDMAKALPKNPVIVDIGANAGFFDFILLSKIESATIYAYEPIDSNVTMLSKSIEENERLKQCIHLFKYAVSGSDLEYIDLFVEATDDNQVVASVFEDFNTNNSKKVQIPCISLMQIIQQNNLASIDLLKIDCEGSEYDIVYNTPKELLLLAKNICIETHEVDGKKNNFKSIISYIESIGFTTSATEIDEKCHLVNCINTLK